VWSESAVGGASAGAVQSVGGPGVALVGKVAPAEQLGSTAGCGLWCHVHPCEALGATVVMAYRLRFCCVSSLKAAPPGTAMNRMCLWQRGKQFRRGGGVSEVRATAGKAEARSTS